MEQDTEQEHQDGTQCKNCQVNAEREILTARNSQFNAPCKIGIQSRQKWDLNYITGSASKTELKPAKSVQTTGNSRNRKKPNFIRIKLDGNDKDIIIKFSDKETLIKSLRELLGVI